MTPLYVWLLCKTPFSKNIFKKADDTLILSDIHLTTAEPNHPHRPYWKKFNRKEYFIDEEFAKLLQKATASLKKRIELVLAGDILDFDSVTSTPKDADFTISWLERKRGLNSEELKSLYKVDQIIAQHPVFFKALNDFILAGNRVVFIIGNHDMEFHWPSVQEKIIRAIGGSEEVRVYTRFCSWFYISNADTLIEHGNQYDPYCSAHSPINPFFKHLKNTFVKLPFGNLTHRYMINGMGIFNPHVDSTYLLNFKGYVKRYFKTIRTQPFLFRDWLFGAFTAWFVAIRDGVAPRVKNPLAQEDQYRTIAVNANADPSMVRTLREIHARPVSWNIMRILRVLWLDRAFVLFLIFFIAGQCTIFLRLFTGASFYWFFLFFTLLMPFYFLYSKYMQTIRPAAKGMINTNILKLATQITHTSRLVCGHSHSPELRIMDAIEYVNSGYWSPSFKDIKCTIAEKNKSFVWIKPDGKKRSAQLLFWEDVADLENPFENT